MIKRLNLKFGSAKGEAALQLEVTPITVFVGPNNSGKSKILREIQYFCREGQLDARSVILDEVTLSVVAHKHIPTDLIISSFLDSN